MDNNKTVPKMSLSKSITKEEFFGLLFKVRNQIHLAHLRVNGEGSYARHAALGDFYDELLDLTDILIESVQGKHGILNITVPEAKAEDPIKVISDLSKLCDCGPVYEMFKETWIQNELDEISKLCYQTLYKLKNLK
jgi:hypothetical protein